MNQKLFLIAAFLAFSLAAIAEVSTADLQGYVLKEKTFVSNKSIIIDDVPIRDLTVQAYNQTWLDFDGVNDYVNLSSTKVSDITRLKDFSINAWIKTSDSRSIGNSIIGKRNTDSNNAGFQLTLLNTNHALMFYLCDGSAKVLRSSSNSKALNDSQWHMVSVGVNRGSQANLYVDGAGYTDLDIFSQKGSLENNLSLAIGSEWHNPGLGTGWFNGSIDSPQFFNRILLPRDVREIYAQSALGGNLGEGVIVLNYHSINDNDASKERSNSYVADFIEQMAYLNSLGAHTITYKQLDGWKNGLFVLPKKPIIINFDDYSNSIYSTAKPILDAYGFKGTYSINTEVVGTSESSNGYEGVPISWQKLKSLSDSGWEIISHGTTHTASTSLDSSDLTAWFNGSRTAIKNNLALSSYPIAFVYPWAVSNSTIDAVCLKYYAYCIHETGAFASENAFNHKNNINSSTIVRITSLGNATSLNEFKQLFGIWDYNISLNFNENSGTAAYDFSGNGNNGIIYGAAWKNDKILKTLKERDYTFNEKTGELVPSNEYLYTWFNATYYVQEDNPAPEPPVPEPFNDTIPPIITGIYPNKSFTNGVFSFRFIEKNPKEISVSYGNLTEKRVDRVDLDSCSKEGNETVCDIKVDLREFDGQAIAFRFHVEDIAGNYNDSKQMKIKVDVSPPVLNNLGYYVGNVGWRYITYIFNISEPNFNKITYTDAKDGRIVSSGTLCSYLRNGICMATKSISRGNHTITIQILDKAGNSDSFGLDAVI